MNRYDELSQKINLWFMYKEQDINILSSLYAQSHLEENQLVDRSVDLKNETMFSELSDEELIARFEKKFFNKYTTNELVHLFQEAHNRFIKENKYDVTRNVVVMINEQEPGMGGYVSMGDDLLFINKCLINRGKAIKQGSIINENSIGKIYLDVLFHETKHVIQYEDAIDFALDKKQNITRKAAGAIMLLNNTNFYIANRSGDYGYFEDWKDNYDFHFYEHEANYAAMQRIEKFYSAEKKKSLDYAQFQTVYMDASLHFRPTPGQDEENARLCEERVKNLEEFLAIQLEYFADGTYDCSLKKKVLDTMKEYYAVDENGESLIHKRLTKEVNELCKMSIRAQKLIAKYEKENCKDEGSLLPDFIDSQSLMM